MKETAWAKINLTLRIGARRAGDRPAGERPAGERPAGERPAGDRPADTDGLHEVCSLVVFADLADHLEIRSGDGFEVSGVWADKLPQNQDNLALKALRFLGAASLHSAAEEYPCGRGARRRFGGCGGGGAGFEARSRSQRLDGAGRRCSGVFFIPAALDVGRGRAPRAIISSAAFMVCADLS